MINVMAGIIEREEKYLIGKRKAGGHLGGKWEFPGGKVKRSESPEECLHRELKEELGRDFVIGDFFDEVIHDYGQKKIKLIAYYARCSSRIFSLNAHDVLRWVPRNELKNYNFCEADLPFVERLTIA